MMIMIKMETMISKVMRMMIMAMMRMMIMIIITRRMLMLVVIIMIAREQDVLAKWYPKWSKSKSLNQLYAA